MRKRCFVFDREQTSAGLLEIGTAISQFQAGVIAVAGLVAEVLDDGVDGRLLHHTRRISAGAAQLRLPAAPTENNVTTERGDREENQNARAGRRHVASGAPSNRL